jgi:hypothetical protein
MTSVTRLNRTRVRFRLDVALFAAFLLTLTPQITGMRAHQCLGIGVSTGVIIHLALHWQWIRTILKRVLKPLPLPSRVNVVLDTLLFIVAGTSGGWAASQRRAECCAGADRSGHDVNAVGGHRGHATQPGGLAGLGAGPGAPHGLGRWPRGLP